MESHQYIRHYTLIMTLLIGIAGTIAAVAYAATNSFVPTSLQIAVDRAVQKHDMAVCGVLDETAGKDCYKTVYPVVATKETCPRIPYTDVQALCGTYFDALAKLRVESESLRKQFTYDQVHLQLTLRDGSMRKINALVADTDEKRVQGLSYVTSMRPEDGMLFSFPEGMQDIAFHMKDMQLPLDMIFMTKDFTPVATFRNLPSCAGVPDSQCPLQLRKGNDVRYVLEILPQGQDVLGVQVTQ